MCINKIYKLTNAPIEYFNNIVQFILTIYSLTATTLLFFSEPKASWIHAQINNLSTPIKAIILVVLLFFTARIFRRVLLDTKYIVSWYQYANNLDEINKEKRIDSITSYSRLIPRETVIRELTSEIIKKIHKEWDPYSYIREVTLDIWNRDGIFEPVVNVVAHSDHREADVTVSTEKLRIPQQKISIFQIKHSDHNIVLKPFYTNKGWRKFVIRSLERLESQIAGKSIYIHINSFLNVTRLYVDPGSTPQHTYTFYQVGDKICSDPRGKTIISTYS